MPARTKAENPVPEPDPPPGLIEAPETFYETQSTGPADLGRLTEDHFTTALESVTETAPVIDEADQPIILYDRSASPLPEEPPPAYAALEEMPASLIEAGGQEALVGFLPEPVLETLEAYRAAAEPDEAIALASLTLSLATAVADLQTLYEIEAEEETIGEAEQLVTGIYEELLIKIGVSDRHERQELLRQFIARVKLVEPAPETVTVLAAADETEGTHEHKSSLHWPQLAQGLVSLRHALVARLMVRAAILAY